jgi:hypothetical protein
MKLDDVIELWRLRQRAADAAAREAAQASTRRAEAEAALAAHEETVANEIAQAPGLGLWHVLGAWYQAAERRLHELRDEAGRRDREAAVARESLRAAVTDAERFETVAGELSVERRAEAARRAQLAQDEAALRRRFG